MVPMGTKSGVILVSRREAAAMYGVSERTLFTLTQEGIVPCVKLGKRAVRYSVAALEKCAEQLQSTPTV